MIRRLSCLLVVASMAAACGTEDPEADGTPASDPTVNALEASGQVEFFVRVVGANGQVFSGESNSAAFPDSIPAIRYFSDVNRGAVGPHALHRLPLHQGGGSGQPTAGQGRGVGRDPAERAFRLRAFQ